MATQRQINKMDRHEAHLHLSDILRQINSALNLDGIDGDALESLRDAATQAEVDAAIDSLLTPSCSHRRGSCDHDFPAWLVAEARPACNRYRRAWRQIEKSPAA